MTKLLPVDGLTAEQTLALEHLAKLFEAQTRDGGIQSPSKLQGLAAVLDLRKDLLLGTDPQATVTKLHSFIDRLPAPKATHARACLEALGVAKERQP